MVRGRKKFHCVPPGGLTASVSFSVEGDSGICFLGWLSGFHELWKKGPTGVMGGGWGPLPPEMTTQGRWTPKKGLPTSERRWLARGGLAGEAV